MEHIHSFPRDIIEWPNCDIFMPDGCRLSARIWMPVDAEENPVPAILEYLPYRKRDGTAARDSLTHPWFAGHGYACIRVDMRGNGDSDGLMDDEYTPQELQDARDVIDWATAQPWCSGRVGMMGISWGGFNGLEVAMLRPPGLKAVITLSSTVDRFADDIHYKGGCLLNANFGWAATMLSYSSRPPDPELVGDNWRKLWLQRLEAQPFLASTWLAKQVRDAYWQHGSLCEDYASIEAAVLSIGGWHDGYRNTISHLVSNLSAPVKGIVGPWNHKYPHIAAPEPKIGFLQEAKKWWDKWLKDIDTGVDNDPDYRVWLMDGIIPARQIEERPGRWIAEQVWPSPNISNHTLYFGSGVLQDAPIAINNTIASPPGSGQNAGIYFPFNYGPEMPDAQNVDNDKATTFLGVSLTEPLDIVGAPVVEISASTDKPMGLVAARLCDVAPDGVSALITMGLLNLTHRHSSATPEALIPGEAFTVTITLDQIAYRIPAGHRLQVALSTDYWPFIWPSPENACLTLTSGHLTFPSRPLADDNEWSFPPPQGAAAWNIETLRESSSKRTTHVEPDNLTTVTIVENDFGEQKDLDHGLLSGSRATEKWTIREDDPLSATTEIFWEQSGGRDDWLWASEAEMSMTCDAENFYLKGHLKIIENGDIFFEKTYEDVVKRRYV